MDKLPQSSAIGTIIWCLVIFGFMYFLMIRPNQRKMAEYKKMLDGLKVGARIVCAGGLYGVIKSVEESTLKIEIAGGVIVEVAKSSVSNIM